MRNGARRRGQAEEDPETRRVDMLREILSDNNRGKRWSGWPLNRLIGLLGFPLFKKLLEVVLTFIFTLAVLGVLWMCARMATKSQLSSRRFTPPIYDPIEVAPALSLSFV